MIKGGALVLIMVSLLLLHSTLNTTILLINNPSTASIIMVEPLINETFVYGVVKLNVYSQKPSVDVYVNGTLHHSLRNGNGWLVEFNTSTWKDDLYIIDFVAYDVNERYLLRLVWFVDNNPPVSELKLPVLTPGGKPWVNGSIAPVMDPILLNESDYVKIINDSVYYKLYVKGVDRWINFSTLYINDTIAEVYYRGSIRKGVFNGNTTSIVYVKIPGSGLYYLKLEVIDLPGKASYSILKVLFDLDKPMLKIDEPINGTITNATTVGFKLTPFDETSRLCIMGFAITTSMSAKPNLTSYMPIPGRFTVTSNESLSFNLTFAKSSSYIIWFITIDEALNYRETPVVIIIDNTPPDFIFELNPLNEKLRIKIIAFDNTSGIGEIRIYMNGSLITTTRNSTVETIINVSSGYHIVEITAVDRAGNAFSRTTTVYVNASTTTTQILENKRGAGYSKTLLIPLIITVIILAVASAMLIISRSKAGKPGSLASES